MGRLVADDGILLADGCGLLADSTKYWRRGAGYRGMHENRKTFIANFRNVAIIVELKN